MTRRRIDRQTTAVRGGRRARRGTVPVLLLCVAAVAAISPAKGQVTANFRIVQLGSGCYVDDQDPWPSGDPERYYSFGIFDSSSTSVLNACATSCSPDAVPSTLDAVRVDYCTTNTGCGVLPLGSSYVTKVIPDQSGAYFYLGMWDEDADADDSLGDHWVWASSFVSQSTTLNYNNSPYYADNPIVAVCGSRDVEGVGNSSNFDLAYRIWFLDSSSPTVPSSVRHSDDGLSGVYWNNDGVFEIFWTNGQDPHSGISAHRFDLYSGGTYYFDDATAPSDGSMTICASGCDRTLSPIHGQQYQLRVGAFNGAYPTLTNEGGFAASGSTWSGWITFATDLVNPVSAVTGPPAGLWHNGTFLATVADTDSGAGIDPGACRYEVRSSGLLTQGLTGRSCNGSISMSVGSTGLCRHEGANTCQLQVESRDLARRISSPAARTFSIDWTPDAILQILGWTTVGGQPITEGVWTRDNTPSMEVRIEAGASPLVGASWAMEFVPDCTPDTGSANPLTIQLGVTADGMRTFGVRAIDEAGNCGPYETFQLWIDSTADPVSLLEAYAAGGSPQVLDGVWAPYAEVDMVWAATSMSPITSYSYALSGVPDCIADTTDTGTSLGALAQGITPFGVRALDEAGNCGPAEFFDLAVDTVGDAVADLLVYREEGGEEIFAGVWQQDQDPWITWDAPVSTSPIVGYDVGVDQVPSCAAVLGLPGYQFPAGSLSDGMHTLYVRATDEAGNCGSPASFAIWVNSSLGVSPGDILDTLRVQPNATLPGDLDLTWGASCSSVGTDYTIHEGALGAWYSHAAKLCTTGGATSATITPGAGDRYFLVVPASISEEGSYGTDSTGTQRPASGLYCMPQAPPAPCP